MVWLPEVKKSLVISLAVLIEYRRVTVGRTYGWTSRDSTVRAMHSTRGKNESETTGFVEFRATDKTDCQCQSRLSYHVSFGRTTQY